MYGSYAPMHDAVSHVIFNSSPANVPDAEVVCQAPSAGTPPIEISPPFTPSAYISEYRPLGFTRRCPPLLGACWQAPRGGGGGGTGHVGTVPPASSAMAASLVWVLPTI